MLLSVYIIVHLFAFLLLYPEQSLTLTIFAVDSPCHHVRLKDVLHLLPTETGQVLLLNEVTLLFLQWEPGTVDEPLGPHHRDAVLLFMAGKQNEECR